MITGAIKCEVCDALFPSREDDTEPRCVKCITTLTPSPTLEDFQTRAHTALSEYHQAKASEAVAAQRSRRAEAELRTLNVSPHGWYEGQARRCSSAGCDAIVPNSEYRSEVLAAPLVVLCPDCKRLNDKLTTSPTRSEDADDDQTTPAPGVTF